MSFKIFKLTSKLIIFTLFVINLFEIKVFAFDFVNTYPYGNENPAGNAPSETDGWGWYKWNCTSYVGWKVRESYISNFTNTFFRNNITDTFGNAYHWDDAASNLGFQVTTSPGIGYAAIWESNTPYGPSDYGHIAWVERVNEDNTINISQYNMNFDGAYHEARISLSSIWAPNKYIVWSVTNNVGCNETIQNMTISSGTNFTCRLRSISIYPETNFNLGSESYLTSY